MSRERPSNINQSVAYRYDAVAKPIVALSSLPSDWIEKLSGLLVQFNTRLNAPLEKHIGKHSGYSTKKALIEALGIVYQRLFSNTMDAQLGKLSNDEKQVILGKLCEDINQCTEGFHNRVNAIVSSFHPKAQSISQLLQIAREDLVLRTAAKVTDEVHATNRFTVIAAEMGLGVTPTTKEDKYFGAIKTSNIVATLKKAFHEEYSDFNLIKLIVEQLKGELSYAGYGGIKSDYDLGDMISIGKRLEVFIPPDTPPTESQQSTATYYAQYFRKETDEDEIALYYRDMDWELICQRLMTQLHREQYFLSMPVPNNIFELAACSFQPPLTSPEEVQSTFQAQTQVFFKDEPVDFTLLQKAYEINPEYCRKHFFNTPAFSDLPNLTAAFNERKINPSLKKAIATEVNITVLTTDLITDQHLASHLMEMLILNQYTSPLFSADQKKELIDKILENNLTCSAIPSMSSLHKLLESVPDAIKKDILLSLTPEKLKALIEHASAGCDTALSAVKDLVRSLPRDEAMQQIVFDLLGETRTDEIFYDPVLLEGGFALFDFDTQEFLELTAFLSATIQERIFRPFFATEAGLSKLEWLIQTEIEGSHKKTYNAFLVSLTEDNQLTFLERKMRRLSDVDELSLRVSLLKSERNKGAYLSIFCDGKPEMKIDEAIAIISKNSITSDFFLSFEKRKEIAIRYAEKSPEHIFTLLSTFEPSERLLLSAALEQTILLALSDGAECVNLSKLATALTLFPADFQIQMIEKLSDKIVSSVSHQTHFSGMDALFKSLTAPVQATLYQALSEKIKHILTASMDSKQFFYQSDEMLLQLMEMLSKEIFSRFITENRALIATIISQSTDINVIQKILLNLPTGNDALIRMGNERIKTIFVENPSAITKQNIPEDIKVAAINACDRSELDRILNAQTFPSKTYVALSILKLQGLSADSRSIIIQHINLHGFRKATNPLDFFMERMRILSLQERTNLIMHSIPALMDTQSQAEKPVVSSLRQIAILEETFPNERWTLALKDNLIATEKRALLEIINATIKNLNTEQKALEQMAFFRKRDSKTENKETGLVMAAMRDALQEKISLADLHKIATENPKSKTAIRSEYKAALNQVIDLLSAASPVLRVTGALSDVNAASSMVSHRY